MLIYRFYDELCLLGYNKVQSVSQEHVVMMFRMEAALAWFLSECLSDTSLLHGVIPEDGAFQNRRRTKGGQHSKPRAEQFCRGRGNVLTEPFPSKESETYI
jgi:hypothetical protein